MANGDAKFGDITTQTEELGGISILATVADQIKSINPRVEEQVVDTLVERELEKRANALVILIDRLSTLEKDLKRIKPDQSSYDETGKVISESYSRSQLDNKNKAKGKIKRITDAINKALIEKDYSNVYQLANEKDDAPGKDKKGSGEEG